MKKGKILLGLIMSFIAAQTVVFAAECTKSPISDSSCPSSSTFYDSLRFEHKYGFNDYFYAVGGTNNIVGLSYEIKEQCDYNNSSVETQDGFFYTTNDLRNRKGVLPARTEPYWIITSNDYEVRKLPPKRDKGNLLVKYNVTYNVNGGSNKTHTECMYYEITRCGDGTLDSGYETCDPNDSTQAGWGDGGCSADCKPVKKGACSSTYNGQRVTTLSGGNHLCKEGTYSSFYHDTVNHKWTWKCNNSLGNGEECSATEPYCGDGIKDSGEKCDPGDTVNKTGWGNGGCDKVTCTPINVGDPLCNSQYNGQRLDSLTEGDHLCTEGKYSEFKYHESLHKWTWKCKNSLGNGVDCSAVKPYCGDGVKDPGEECDGSDDCSDTCKIMYCGDGIKNNGEECDPNDSSQAGWGPDGCNQFCEPKFNPDVSCTQTFKKTLRCGESYSFPDSFKAGGTDRWMYSFSVNFQEGSDLNGGSNPTFLWTDVLKNNNMLVKAGQTMKIIDSTPKYQIKNCPSKRSYENLYIEYIVTTAGENPNGQELPNAKLSTHKECVYYDVSRCGDGVLDEDYNEECDPGSAGTSTLPDGRICNSDCKIEDVPSKKGKLKVEKTLISESKYVTEKGQELEWQIKVTAVDGDVKNVLITDKLPEILSYVSYTSELPSGVTMNSGQPTKSNNDKIIKWQTSGTLKEGKSIILKVKTKVEIMPKKTDSYNNVACAEADDIDEDCQPVPIITPGTLTVEKKLISENKYVTKVGQELEWQIKVTAVDGDVDNVVIKDILPEILSYVSYTSDLPSGVTMNSGQPTKSDNGKTIKWKTSGTLKEGKSIILKVKTKVDIMPKKTDNYENVACAEADDVDEDCVPVPVGKGTLEPDKTLVSSKEVKKVGDLVIWKLKVTAVGGDVEDPIITDKLPPVLGYTGYMVINQPSGIKISDPIFGTKDSLETIEWDVTGTLKENDYIEIQLTTYAKVMPDKEYKNVLCVKPKNNPEDEKCDDVPVPAPKLRIKKSFSDGTKEKTVKVGDIIEYKITFGNKGTASATITSVKDFLPKNVEYVSSEIHITGSSNHTNNPSGSDVIYSNKKVDGVYIDIYGGITLEPGTEGYILLKGKILSDNKDNRTNFACIYLNDKKPDDSIIDGDRCDDAVHKFDDGLLCGAPEITTKSFTSAGGSTSVVCKASGGKKANIELDCGSGATLSGSKSSILTGSNISSLTGTCVYPSNSSSSSKSYTVSCKVNGETGDSCKDKVSVPGQGGPGGGPSCDKITTDPDVTTSLTSGKDIKVTCTATSSAYILIDCNYKAGNKYDDSNNVSTGRVTTFTGTCKNFTQDSKIQCLVKEHESDSWQSAKDSCGKKVTIYSPTCFPAGTKVTMADGTKKNIEDIEEGDMVLSYNTDTNTNESSTVAKTIIHEDSEHEMYELTINGKVLKATAVHPFYVRKSGFTNMYNRTFGAKNLIVSIDYDWVEAQDLKVGDKLLMIDGSLVEIEKINHYPNKETVYNLEVEGNHDYFVDQGYLVHNKSCFLAGTKVIMADGTIKNIEDVKIGEKVLGSNGSINTVLSYDRHLLGERRVWSINGGEYFVSDEHPFMTTEGWKSFVPEKTKEELGWDIPELKVGDVLVTSNGLEKIERVDSKEMDRDTPIYNFVLDGDNTYHANGYLVHNKGVTPSSCFVAGTQVTMADGTKKNIEDVEIGEKLLGSDGSINTVLNLDRHILGDRHIWSINGGDYFVSDEHPFRTTEGWKSFVPEKTKEEIGWTIQELKVGDILITDNGLEKIEKVDSKAMDYYTPIYNFILDGDHTYYADGYLVHNKNNPPSPDPIIYPMVECYDINANQLSYEQGEILPFYWNLDNLSKEDIWYLSGSFNKPVSGKCEEDEEGLIALNSMVCSYAIIDPDLNTKLTGNFPCLTEENFTVEPLYNSRLEVGKNTMCGTSNNKCYFSFTTKATKTKLWSNLNTIPNFGEGRTRFGEYKISMTKISYLQCIDGKWTQKDKTSEKELCSSTFMLTNPYTVQKTPSGNFKASTETLSKYKYCEKYEKVEGTNNLKCIKWNSIDRLLNAITPSAYKQNEAVNKAMEGFINKYSKLAVSAGNGLKKVPGKNIYFVNGPICLGSECNVIKLDKPTTIVQIDGSAEIKGDVNTDNLMLLTKGKIKFSDSNSCTHRQIVKGIFYAEKGIERELVTKNKPDRVKKQGAKRCTEGGLTIKGVLIGDGLEQMMKYSRSNLNGWHKSKTAQTVMNGASVLIEYSPSVFTKGSMPPGAEDFTTALSIYKD